MKISELSLEELYAREKVTPVVEKAIIAKADFSKIEPNYCEKVCRLKCKAYEQASLQQTPIYPLDILIIQDHRALNQKFDKNPGDRERINKEIIEYVCKRAGFTGLSYKIVDLLKCNLDLTDLVRGQPPTYTILSKCRPYVLNEIERLKPKVILSLATSVTKVLGFAKYSNVNNRGEILDNKYVLSLHPRILGQIRQTTSNANAPWGHEYLDLLTNDFKKAARLARGEFQVPSVIDAVEEAKKRINICRSIEEVNFALNELNDLPESAIVSFDIEATGLDPMADDAKILMIQFGYRDLDGVIKSYVIPLWHRKNTYYDSDLVWPRVAELLEGVRKKVAHNGKFDITYIWFTKGCRVRNFEFDTMKVLHSIDSGLQGNYGLKAAVWDWLYESGLGGYEDLLPPLTKSKKLELLMEKEDGDDMGEGDRTDETLSS